MSKLSSQESKRVETSAQVPDLMWRAFPPDRHANRKSWLSQVATSLRWNPRRVKALFYCEARVVTADEWRTLNARLDAAKKREKANDELRAIARGLGASVPVAAREDAAALPFEAGEAAPSPQRQAR